MDNRAVFYILGSQCIDKLHDKNNNYINEERLSVAVSQCMMQKM